MRKGGRGRPLNSIVRHCVRSIAVPIGKTMRLVAANIVAVAHLMFSVVVAQTPSEGSWQWFTMFVIDFPFSLLWLLLLQSVMDPLIFFGMLGSAWWFLVTYWGLWLIASSMSKWRSNA